MQHRTCVLCDKKIRASYRLCTAHYAQYGDMMSQEWFKELAKAQAKQDEIDRLEAYEVPYHSSTTSTGEASKLELLSRKNVGRPATDWRIVDKVLQIYDTSVDQVELGLSPRIKSLRLIAHEVGNSIDHCTVRNILKVYRKQKM